MEHLDSLLKEMGTSYQKVTPDRNFYYDVLKKVEAKQAQKNNNRIFGIIGSILIILGGIIFSNIGKFVQMGSYFSLYVYLFYGFALMAFIFMGLITTQNFIHNILGQKLMRQINSHSCFFTTHENPELKKV